MLCMQQHTVHTLTLIQCKEYILSTNWFCRGFLFLFGTKTENGKSFCVFVAWQNKKCIMIRFDQIFIRCGSKSRKKMVWMAYVTKITVNLTVFSGIFLGNINEWHGVWYESFIDSWKLSLAHTHIHNHISWYKLLQIMSRQMLFTINLSENIITIRSTLLQTHALHFSLIIRTHTRTNILSMRRILCNVWTHTLMITNTNLMFS